MRNTYNRRGSGFSRPNHSRSNYTRFPPKNRKKVTYGLSEIDLIRSIEYSKKRISSDLEHEYVSVNTFEKFEINNQIKINIRNKHYKDPTPVQDQAIPHILDGRDLIGVANTGTGKTAAFLIPLIDKSYKDRSQKVLIIAPTRELSEQIFNDFRELSFGMNLFSALIIGGTGMRKQISDLHRNPNFVIGTPGRLKDMMQRKYLNLSQFNNVVLDETDRMVDIGFFEEIRLFISMLPKKRQSLFFSATVSKKVQEIINSFVQNPVVIDVKKSETRANIKQDIVRVTKNQRKIDTLHDLLIQNEFNKVIVFGNTKWSVQKLSDELVGRGFKADAIHGDKRQNQRHSILEKFKKNEIKILLATDVAARGLDISNVSHVINYDLPKTYNDYVHRIGRTGRVDKTGVALTFVSS